jgi:hypothetical protein
MCWWIFAFKHGVLGVMFTSAQVQLRVSKVYLVHNFLYRLKAPELAQRVNNHTLKPTLVFGSRISNLEFSITNIFLGKEARSGSSHSTTPVRHDFLSWQSGSAPIRIPLLSLSSQTAEALLHKQE